MKLIIDIPEETYQIIRDTQHLGDSGEATLENVLIRAVENSHSIDDIQQIINECECIQALNESEYTKERAKLVAYDHIKELMEDNNNDR